MDDLMEKIIGISIAITIAVAMFPTSLESFFAVNTTNWSATAKTLWALIPVFAIIALALLFFGYVRYRRGKRGK